MTDNTSTDYSAGRFRSMTGLSDKALRLYADREILVPTAVDPVTGYRSYDADQLRDGITLDLLRRARLPLDDLHADRRFRFDDHRGQLAMRRAMEDFYLDLAERVATGDPAGLVAAVSEAGPAHWVAAEVPFEVSSSTDDLEETFTAMAVDLPHLDRTLVDALQSEGVELVDESWTVSTQGAAARLRLAHRALSPVRASTLEKLTDAVRSSAGPTARVTSGTLPARRELVHSSPDGDPADDPGLTDSTLSYLGVLALARYLADEGAETLHETARRRVLSTSLFDPTATPEDVYDLRAG